MLRRWSGVYSRLGALGTLSGMLRKRVLPRVNSPAHHVCRGVLWKTRARSLRLSLHPSLFGHPPLPPGRTRNFDAAATCFRKAGNLSRAQACTAQAKLEMAAQVGLTERLGELPS